VGSPATPPAKGQHPADGGIAEIVVGDQRIDPRKLLIGYQALALPRPNR
jgi:hypothetical protein